MHGRLGVSVLAALWAWCFAVGAARAQPADAGTSGRPYDSGRAVDVTVVASEDVKDLVNTVREVVGRLGLQVRVQVVQEGAPETGENALARRLARAEINLLAPDAVQVVVFGRSGQVVLQQRFARNVSAPVLREEVADAVRSAVEAQLLIDPERAIAPAPTTSAPTRARAADTAPGPASPFSVAEPPVAEPPSAKPPAPATPAVASVGPAPPLPSEAPTTPVASWARPLALDLTALAGVGGFAWRTAYIVGHVGGQATLAYRVRKWRNPSLTITGDYLVPFDARREGVDARVDAVSVRIVPAIQVFQTPILAIEAGAGAGLDVINVEAKVPSNYAPAGPVTRVDPVLRGVVAAHVGLAPRFVLSLVVAYDLDVATNLPWFGLPGDTTTVISPWRARPEALVGLTVAALGEARFASGILR